MEFENTQIINIYYNNIYIMTYISFFGILFLKLVLKGVLGTFHSLHWLKLVLLTRFSIIN